MCSKWKCYFVTYFYIKISSCRVPLSHGEENSSARAYNNDMFINCVKNGLAFGSASACNIDITLINGEKSQQCIRESLSKKDFPYAMRIMTAFVEIQLRAKSRTNFCNTYMMWLTNDHLKELCLIHIMLHTNFDEKADSRKSMLIECLLGLVC